MRLWLFLWIACTPLFAIERVISLSPALTEILFDLGLGAHVVATSQYTTYPKEAQSLPQVGGYFHPSLETILAFSPTLVVGHENSHNYLAKLSQLGITTLALRSQTLEEIKESIEALGAQFGVDAKKLIIPIDAALSKGAKNPINPPPRVLIVFGTHESLEQALYIAGKGLFYEQILAACGAQNAYTATHAGQPVLYYEGLLALNPDRVILLHSTLTQEAAAPIVKQTWLKLPITAAQNGAIEILDGDYISIPSHRVARTIEDICGAIHAH